MKQQEMFTPSEISSEVTLPETAPKQLSLTISESFLPQENPLKAVQNDLKVKVELSKSLSDFVQQNRLSVTIQGSNYLMVNGWQFALSLFGVVPIITETKEMNRYNETGEVVEYRYYSSCNLVNKDGNVVGRGDALCSNKEAKKRSFDEYAVLSMSQTRANFLFFSAS